MSETMILLNATIPPPPAPWIAVVTVLEHICNKHFCVVTYCAQQSTMPSLLPHRTTHCLVRRWSETSTWSRVDRISISRMLGSFHTEGNANYLSKAAACGKQCGGSECVGRRHPYKLYTLEIMHDSREGSGSRSLEAGLAPCNTLSKKGDVQIPGLTETARRISLETPSRSESLSGPISGLWYLRAWGYCESSATQRPPSNFQGARGMHCYETSVDMRRVDERWEGGTENLGRRVGVGLLPLAHNHIMMRYFF